MRLYFLILWIGLYVFMNEMTLAQAQQGPSHEVEIVVEGKRYESVPAYKREQIKKALIRSLSSMSLHSFSEEELCDIIKGVRNLQIAGTSTNEAIDPKKQKFGELQENQQKTEGDVHDLGASQMQEMLNDYFKKHKDEDGDVPDAISNTMDLWNNQIGADMSRENPEADEETLVTLVRVAVISGMCRIVKRNSSGDFLDLSGNVIKREQWHGKWVNPRCLVTSDKTSN